MNLSSRQVRLLALCLVLGACRSFEVEKTQFAIIDVPTTATGSGFTSAPTAFFFEGTSIRLSTTEIGAEGCIEQQISQGGGEPFAYIDAGDALDVSLSGQTATLVPTENGTRITYALPGGTSIPFTPGDIVRVSIPGAIGGFPTALLSARTVTPFVASPVTVPTSSADNLTVTWQDATPVLPGTAMFYSFKYAATGTSIFDREVACVFIDDGSGTVPAASLVGFRASEFRQITAQRARITIDRVGTALTHLTSSYSVFVPITADE